MSLEAGGIDHPRSLIISIFRQKETTMFVGEADINTLIIIEQQIG